MNTQVHHIEKLNLILKHFSHPTKDKYGKTEVGLYISVSEFPIPQLIFYILVVILQYPKQMYLEKIFWIIPFRYKDMFFEIAYQKFGLVLYFPEELQDKTKMEELKNEILYYFRNSIKFAEKHILTDLAKQQLRSWSITVDNQYVEFTNMYHYFREQASDAFGDKKTISRGAKEVFSPKPNMFQWNLIGFYNTYAMLDTYFSRLEHLLVLSLPFMFPSKSEPDLVKFISSNWTKKYQTIFDIHSNKKAKLYFDRLYAVKEKYRNTFAHGGFEKEGASLFFQLDKVGAISCSLSKYDKSPFFNFFRIEEPTYENICKLFDEFDNWLKVSPIKYGLRFAESGIEIPFDKNSRLEYQASMGSDDLFEELIQKRGYISDMHSNMDF